MFLFELRQLGKQLLPLDFVGLDWDGDFTLLWIAFLDWAGDKRGRMRYTHIGQKMETYHVLTNQNSAKPKRPMKPRPDK